MVTIARPLGNICWQKTSKKSDKNLVGLVCDWAVTYNSVPSCGKINLNENIGTQHKECTRIRCISDSGQNQILHCGLENAYGWQLSNKISMVKILIILDHYQLFYISEPKFVSPRHFYARQWKHRYSHSKRIYINASNHSVPTVL